MDRLINIRNSLPIGYNLYIKSVNEGRKWSVCVANSDNITTDCIYNEEVDDLDVALDYIEDFLYR